ncbi:MAG: NADH-quinone oxidoreductase subunit I [Spirochaetia bacterium]|nr:NADH-quinone oxidoreductase subunit I [Spirochaetia bacterium]
MNPALQYFRNIFDSAYTVFDGLSITFSYLFQKPVTLEYPNRNKKKVQDTLPDRFRGFLEVNHLTCTTCDACAKACPIDCITMDGVKVPGRKGKAPVYFYIDISKCMFCGLCIPPCPTDAIYFTKEFEGSSYDPKQLIYSYVSDETAKEYLEQNRILQMEKEKEDEGEEKQ